MYVVDDQDVQTSKSVPEGIDPSLPEGVQKLVGELLAGHVRASDLRFTLGEGIGNALQEVGLADTAPTVNKQG